jgi:hypothetical protein
VGPPAADARVVHHLAHQDLKLPAPKIFGVTPLPARQVQDYVVRNAGARNWDRDREDARVVADTIEGRGYIIDSQSEWGGYPKVTPTSQPFDPSAWNLEDMTPKTPPSKVWVK